jgi:hypothetical protein
MSKFPVLNAFQDMNTLVHFPKGGIYETDDSKRSSFLQGEGFLGEALEEEPKVKGKKKKSPSED